MKGQNGRPGPVGALVTALPLPAARWSADAAAALGDNFLDMAVMHLDTAAYIELEHRETRAREKLAFDIEAALMEYASAVLRLGEK